MEFGRSCDSANLAIEEIIKLVLAEEKLFGTPVLTNVVSHENKIVIKIDKVSTFQWLSEEAKEPNLHFLHVRPVPVTAIKKHHEEPLKLFCAIKLFLDGTKNYKGRSVSIATAFSRETNTPNNINRETVCVYVFLKALKKDSVSTIYTKSYKIVLVDDIEVYKGLHDFIEKKNLREFIHEDGSLIIGISIIVNG